MPFDMGGGIAANQSPATVGDHHEYRARDHLEMNLTYVNQVILVEKLLLDSNYLQSKLRGRKLTSIQELGFAVKTKGKSFLPSLHASSSMRGYIDVGQGKFWSPPHLRQPHKQPSDINGGCHVSYASIIDIHEINGLEFACKNCTSESESDTSLYSHWHQSSTSTRLLIALRPTPPPT